MAPRRRHRRRRLPRVAHVRALLARGDEVVAVDNLVTGAIANIEHLFGRPGFTFIHHDVTDVHLGAGRRRRRAALRQPGVARSTISSIPIQILKVGSLGTHNSLGLAKAKGAQLLPGLDQRGVRRPARAPAARDLLGQRQPHRAARRVRRGQAVRRGDDDGVPPRTTTSTSGSCASSTPTARACGPTTAASCRTSSCRRSHGKPITIYGDGTQTRSFCYVDDEIDGFLALLDSSYVGPVNIGNPDEFTIARAGRARHRDHGLSFDRRVPATSPRRPVAAAAGHHIGTHPARLGTQGRCPRRAHPHSRLVPLAPRSLTASPVRAR